MPLSQWPEDWKDDGGRADFSGSIVEIVFDEEMCVLVRTNNAIGLGEEDEVELWLPISQIVGPVPLRGDWIESIRIPQWLANDKGY